MRRATQAYSLLSVWDGFQSTLSMRRATGVGVHIVAGLDISIHALHEESDATAFNIGVRGGEFQSTLSMRRATATTGRASSPATDFNPRSP